MCRRHNAYVRRGLSYRFKRTIPPSPIARATRSNEEGEAYP
jgi:hypothetical protein